MQLSHKQLAAILKIGKVMVAADGVMKKEEMAIVLNELVKFDVPHTHVPMLLESSDEMTTSTMLDIFSNLDTETQKHICGYLAAIMIADGDVNDKELMVWKVTCSLCNFPTMTIGEALTFWKNN